MALLMEWAVSGVTGTLRVVGGPWRGGGEGGWRGSDLQ